MENFKDDQWNFTANFVLTKKHEQANGHTKRKSTNDRTKRNRKHEHVLFSGLRELRTAAQNGREKKLFCTVRGLRGLRTTAQNGKGKKVIFCCSVKWPA